MKKVLCLIIVAISIFAFTGCSKSYYESNVSEVRNSIFVGESESFEASIYVGQRENPYKADGAANKMVSYFLVIIEPKFETGEDDLMCTNVIINNKTYSKTLTKDVFYNKFVYDFADLKADGNFTINITVQAYDEDVAMLELLSAGQKTYSEALAEAMVMLKDKFEATKDGNKYACEIYVRLTYSKFMTDQRLYWYVSLLDTKGNITGVIIDVNK